MFWAVLPLEGAPLRQFEIADPEGVHSCKPRSTCGGSQRPHFPWWCRGGHQGGTDLCVGFETARLDGRAAVDRDKKFPTQALLMGKP